MLGSYELGQEIRIERHACLAAGPGRVSCTHCLLSCPVGAIALDASGPSVSSLCNGCGRCAAGCPTAAIQVPAFLQRQRRNLPQSTTGDAAFAVACHRADNRAVKADATVHCLGALPSADLLQLIHDHPDRRMTLVDPAACATCPAGGVHAPWADALLIVGERLTRAGLPAEALPTVIRVPHDDHDSENRPDPSRRRLLGALAPLGISVSEIEARPLAGGKKHARQQQRAAELLSALRASRPTDTANYSMPSITITSGCDLCGVCAAVCPTPALAVTETDNDQRALSFEGAQCISCGRCSEVCPQRSVTTVPQGSDGTRNVVLAIRLATCSACDEPFPVRAEETLCASCQHASTISPACLSGHGQRESGPTLLSQFSTRE